MARRRPYRQGNLDGLCGIYAMVNAVDLLRPLDADQAWDLFQFLVRELDRRGALAGAITGGVGKSRAWKLLKLAARHAEREYGVRLDVRRPFRRRGLISVDAFYAALEQELGRGAVAILALLGESDHWTVLHRIGATMLQLHDSDGYHSIRRSGCKLDGSDAVARFEIEQAGTMILHSRRDRADGPGAHQAHSIDPSSGQPREGALSGSAARNGWRVPFRQGHLDSLCGLYAACNAVHLLHPLDRAAASALIGRLVAELETRDVLADAIAGGIDGEMLWHLVNVAVDYLREKECVRLALDPVFRGWRAAEANGFFDALQSEVAGGGAAIICIAGRFELAHWTAVRSVTPQTVQLHDSAGMRYLRRSSCRVSQAGAQGQSAILPAATVLLKPS